MLFMKSRVVVMVSRDRRSGRGGVQRPQRWSL